MQNELVNSRSNKDGSPQNVNVRRKKSLGVDDGAKHAMNELTNKILPGSAHAQTSKKLFEADDGQNLEVKELTGETLPATTYVKAAKKVKAEPQAGSAKPAELRIITSPPQTFEASAQSNKTYTTEPCITPTPHSHSCGSRAPIAITYNHHYHDHHRHLNYFAEEPSNDAPWPFTPMVNKTQVTGCVRVGICASDRAFNTLPLPRRWTAQHDRALCYLEVAGYPSNTFEYHLRTAFPELVGLLPQKTLENRVRTLDQNYEIPYFGEAFKLVHTDTSRHMYDTVLVPSPFSVAAMRGEVYKEPRVRVSTLRSYHKDLS